MNGKQITVESKFDRLVVMETHTDSIHSVSEIVGLQARCCISNYYFSPTPLRSKNDYFRVTSFYGNKNAKEKMILFLDRNLRSFASIMFI